MRRAKKEHRLLPFAAGLIYGYILTLILSVAAAVLLLVTDSAESLSGTISVIITAAACFMGGRHAGKLRRHEGLKTGALCGLLYFAPLLLLGLIFRSVGGVLLIVKLLLCIAFGAAGGVVGVNSDMK